MASDRRPRRADPRRQGGTLALGGCPGADPELRVYSAGIIPALDRIVTTTTDMDKDFAASRNLQLWRLSDLSLLRTFALPDGPRGEEGLLTAEPRAAGGRPRDVGLDVQLRLYLMEGLDGETPSGRLVASFPRKDKTSYAIPVISGHYYLVTVPAWSAVVSWTSAIRPRPAKSVASRSVTATCLTGSQSRPISGAWWSPATRACSTAW